MTPFDTDKIGRQSMTLTRFYNAANATFSDADHMRNDVPLTEAAAYFQRNKKEIADQLRILCAAFDHLDQLTQGDE